MKKDIHPEYMECKVTCACGNTFTTSATRPTLKLDICSECHPFYTGKQKIVDTEGRVERFEQRQRLAEKHRAAAAARKARKAAKEKEQQPQPA